MATLEQRDAALADFAQKVKNEFLEENANVDYSKLRRPGFFSRFLWMGEHAHRAYIWSQLAKEATFAGRKVTATEVDALVEHLDWVWRTRATAQPLSLLLAGFMTWRSRKVFKFPFITPWSSFKPDVFPSESMPLLRGPRARTCWHAARFTCYAPPSWFVMQWIVSEVSVGGYEKGKGTDPRLRELMQQIRATRQAELAKRFAGARPGGQGAQGQTSQPDIRYPRQSQQRPQQEPSYRDDAPPTNGSGAGSETWGKTEGYAETTSYASSSASPSAYRPAPSYGQQPPPSSLPSTPSYSPPPQSQTSPQPGGWAGTSSAFDDDSDDFDDMSPVSPAARRQEAAAAAAANAANSGASAWDRIRKQGAAGVQQQQQQTQTDSGAQWGSNTNTNNAAGGWSSIRQRNSPANSESWTYTAADEEREKRLYEKEKAQKEFDAMVEKERKGQGSSGGSGGSGGGRGWWS